MADDWNEDELKSTLREFGKDGSWRGKKLEEIPGDDAFLRKRLGELQYRGYIQTTPTNEVPRGRTIELTDEGSAFIESK